MKKRPIAFILMSIVLYIGGSFIHGSFNTVIRPLESRIFFGSLFISLFPLTYTAFRGE